MIKIIKPLYKISRAKNHCFNTYYSYYHKKFWITQLIYDFFLLYIKNSSNSRFEIVDFETNNILFLINKIFAIKKEE